MAEDYRVQEGDCISSIAFERGFLPETLWNNDKNAGLKQKRKNPNMLKVGDICHIPDLRSDEKPRVTDKMHSFKLKGTPVRLRLRIMEIPRRDPAKRTSEQNKPEDSGHGVSDQAELTREPEKEEPRSDLPFILIVDGKILRGTTGNDGLIECPIPPNVRDGKLILEPGTPAEFTIHLRIGSLEPVEEIAGAQARLNNLGFRCGAADGILGPRTKAALQRFQGRHGLKTSGTLDQATRSELSKAHDSK